MNPARRARQSIAGWVWLCLPLLASGCGASEQHSQDDVPVRLAAAPPSPICGEPGQACCSAPRVPCARGLWCDVAAGVCGTLASDRPDARFSCNTDADCAPGWRCCSAGLQGTCQAITPGDGCALPDLAVLMSSDPITIEQGRFAGTLPAPGGCVRPRGVRFRLRVAVAVANLGAADFILGQRATRPVDSADVESDFLRYTLLDASGKAVAAARGRFPCSDGDGTLPFTCSFVGLRPGDLAHATGEECEALDVTGLPPGPHVLRVELARPWPDADPSNSRVELSVDLPSFNPRDPCPPLDNALLGSEFRRECGWSPAALPGAGSCTPGAAISLECASCVGFPMLRLCAGDTPCPAATALGDVYLTGTSGGSAPCARVDGYCPGGGRYNVLLASVVPALEASCTLAPSQSF